MPRLADGVVLAGLGEDPVAPGAAGVLIALDRPVAAYADPVLVSWLAEAAVPADLPAGLRARCLAVWQQAGLVVRDDLDDARSGHDEICVERAHALAGLLSGPVIVIGMAMSCGFCAQLEADLAANGAFLARARFGVVLAGDRQSRRFGRVPAVLQAELAELAELAGAGGTPGGMVLGPDSGPRLVRGYDQVTAALTGLCGSGWTAVTEPPTSCSVTVVSAGPQVVYPLAAGDQVAGVAVRERAAGDLVGFLAAHSAGPGYAPPVLIVDRPGALFLVFRGGEMIARLRSAAEVTGLLETVLAGYARAGRACDGVPVLCGAVRHAGGGDDEVLLFPRSWLSGLVGHQSALGRAGWAVCPDPYIPLTGPAPGTGTVPLAIVHPASAGAGPWPARRGPVREILLDEHPAGR